MRFEHLTFANGSAGASGLRFEAQVDQVAIVDSRFYGPLAAAVFAKSERYVEGLHISGCVISACDAGIQFSGSGLGVSSVTIVNNTIHKTKIGILFDSQPQDGQSKDLKFARNAFVEVSEALARVESGYQASEFNRFLKDCKQNATDRAKPGTKELNIFAMAPLVKLAEFGFLSDDVASSDFLKPNSSSPLVKNITEEDGLQPYIGAISP